MTIIAMTREMGSLGKDVAAGVADRLGLEVVHHELVERGVAAHLGLQDSAVHRYLEGGASLLERWKIDKHKLSRYTSEEILQLALKGNVLIRGWGTTALLQNVPHVLRMRVCAPLAARERTMMQRLGLDDSELVRREIERNDAAHARVLESMFAVDWQEPTGYDLVLNTENVPIATCVEMVCGMARSAAFTTDAATQAALSNRLLESRIRAALSERFGLGLTGISITLEQGKVALGGLTDDKALAQGVEQIVLGFSGVTSVDNRICVVRSRSSSM